MGCKLQKKARWASDFFRGPINEIGISAVAWANEAAQSSYGCLRGHATTREGRAFFALRVALDKARAVAEARAEEYVGV